MPNEILCGIQGATNLPRSLDIYHTGTETIHGKITVHQEFAKLSVSEGFFYALFISKDYKDVNDCLIGRKKA